METTLTFKVRPVERTVEAIMHLNNTFEGRNGTAWLERNHVAVTLDLEGEMPAARRDHAKKLLTDALAVIGLEPLELR